ncbi:hypothetical protein ES703_109318 [subsurface metagenome]
MSRFKLCLMKTLFAPFLFFYRLQPELKRITYNTFISRPKTRTTLKTALKAKSEKEAINAVLKQFDTDLQIAEVTLKGAGSFEFEEV